MLSDHIRQHFACLGFGLIGTVIGLPLYAGLT
jgi:hypothetical protein